MDRKTFYAPDIEPNVLGQALYEWLSGQKYQTQILPSQSGAVTVQARKEDTLRTLAGLSTALTLVISSDGENLSVEMGAAKWTEKAVVGGVGVLLFAPALITAGIGVYQQSQLSNNSWKFIENYVQTNSAFSAKPSISSSAPSVSAYPAPMLPVDKPPQPIHQGSPPPPINFAASNFAGASPSSQSVCSSCKQPLRSGAKFCDNCGAPAPVSNLCKSCGKILRPGAKFCDNCGSPVR